MVFKFELELVEEEDEIEDDGRLDCSGGTFKCAFSDGNERRATDTALTIKGKGESCFRCLPSSLSLRLPASRRRSALNLVKSTVSV